jgi:hypothetical protein
VSYTMIMERRIVKNWASSHATKSSK